MSSYLTINNVAYAAGALFLGTLYHQTKTTTKFYQCFPAFTANAALGIIGIAAVAVKEKSLQSSKWAIITSFGTSALIGFLLPFEGDNVKQKTMPYSFGFSIGLTAFAAVSLIIATGKQLAPYITRR